MKMKQIFFACLTIALAGTIGIWSYAASNDPVLRDHGLPSGPAEKTLLQGAILHLQAANVFDTVIQLEQTLVAAIPDKALPPDAQQLLQMEHPLLFLAGQRIANEPLTKEKVQEMLGINPSQPLTVTLYPGDPRRMFIACIPMANPTTLTYFLKNVLKPNVVEEVMLGDKPALRMDISRGKLFLELHIVCSGNYAFVCGDRSLAISLYNYPSSQRFLEDAYLKRATSAVAKNDFSIVFNPALIKPLLLQAQLVRSIGIPLVQAQRAQILKKIPAEARTQMEMQLRNQFSVKNIDEFADFVECILIGSAEFLLDGLTNALVSFEGFGLGMDHDGPYKKLSFIAFGKQFNSQNYAAPIAVNEVRDALAWLGPDYSSFSVVGRQPKPTASAGTLAWITSIKNRFNQKQLVSPFFNELEKLVANEIPPAPLSSKLPWMLTTRASVEPMVSPNEFKTLEEYLKYFATRLCMPLCKPVTVIHNRGAAFLESSIKEETDTLNRNEKSARDFAFRFSGSQPWFDKTSRYSNAKLPDGVSKFTIENSYSTHGGIFGYDQHEWINRRVIFARELDGYLVFHNGLSESSWLKNLKPSSQISPASAKLLAQIPEGANSINVCRVSHLLPEFANWLGDVETLLHKEMDNYLAQADKAIKGSSDKNLAQAVSGIKMPFTIYSLNRNAESGKTYCLLPGFIVYPRSKVVPVLKTALAGYAEKAKEMGGSVSYSRIQGETYEWTLVRNVEAITYFIKSVGNSIFENYLSSEEKKKALQNTIVQPNDFNPQRFEEIIIRNPQWQAMRTPPVRKVAKMTRGAPPRAAEAASNMVNLTSQYNGALEDTWQKGGLENNNLAALPKGIQEFGGTKFDVRGLIQLSGLSAQQQLSVKFPKEVKDIKVNNKAKRIHFLHATGWSAPDGTKIGQYVIHFANGEQREIPIVYGQDVRDWWTQADEAQNDKLQKVWEGTNSTGEGSPKQRLFKTTWQNPLPDVQISHIDYQSALTDSAPFLVAITLE